MTYPLNNGIKLDSYLIFNFNHNLKGRLTCDMQESVFQEVVQKVMRTKNISNQTMSRSMKKYNKLELIRSQD